MYGGFKGFSVKQFSDSKRELAQEQGGPRENKLFESAATGFDNNKVHGDSSNDENACAEDDPDQNDVECRK